MRNLWLVSVMWAFSFPLIGYYLVGRNVSNPLDQYFVILVRFSLAWLVFLPFVLLPLFYTLRAGRKSHALDSETPFLNKPLSNPLKPLLQLLPWRLRLLCVLVGAVQIGLMYVCYYRSFNYLQIHEIALFTIFTPFYVSLFYDMCSRRLRLAYLPSIALAVLGAYVIKMGEVSDDFLVGFLWIQGANLCFGIGQSAYKYAFERYAPLDSDFSESSRNHLGYFAQSFGYFYLGAVIVGAMSFGCFGSMGFGEAFAAPTPWQWGILIYLGVVASGLGYFLWNSGACRVDSGVLAIMNNMLIPLAILANCLFWDAVIPNLTRFALGSALIILSLIWHYKILHNTGEKI